MRLFLRPIFFPAAPARIFCQTAHQSRWANPWVRFYHRFISARLVGQRRWGLLGLVSLLASLGAQAQSSTTVCTTNSIDLRSVVPTPAGSTLSFSKKPPATAIAAGYYHSLALLSNGATRGWGKNDHGFDPNDPLIAIAAGDGYSLGILANGKVVSEGENTYGQRNVPPSASPATAIASNSHHSLAIKADGTVVQWGDFVTDAVPTSATSVIGIAAGYSHNLALKTDGTVLAWGFNIGGVTTAVPTSARPATAIAAGFSHSLALKADGTVVAWGIGQQGVTTVPTSARPATAIAAGDYHSLALKADGSVVAWGKNDDGQLNVPDSANPATAIAAGENHSLALKANGSVVGWGKNTDGQANGYDVEPLDSPVVSPTGTQTYYYIARPPGGPSTYGSVTVVVNPTPPARLYVNANATGVGNGLNWTDAFTDLQQALNYVCTQNLTEIWVAQGTYKPTTGTDRNSSFAMKNGLTLYGGFAGTETALTQRNPTSFTTVLSGDLGSSYDTSDNSYHVINNPPGLTNSAVLDGFLITGSNGNSNQSPGRDGGGMLNNGGGAGNVCSPLIRNCIFQDNVANYGGALYNDGSSGGTSSPSLINCLFLSNFSGLGGALYNNGNGGTSSPQLTNCSFLNNTALNLGQTMSSQGSSNPVLVNCVVWGNGVSGDRTFHNVSGAFITTRYSLLEASTTGYTAGTGTRTTPTLPFVGPTDARLSNCSGAINTGDNTAYSVANGPATDLAGNARIFPSGGVIDMGAYEFQAAPPVNIPLPSVNTTTTGVSFSQSFVASGGSSPYSYSLYSGNLPPGLTLATTGLLSGTPTQAGSFTLTLQATDATGCSVVSLPYVLRVQLDSPIRYVRAGAMGSGSSWAAASGDLQGQIDLAGTEQVWVAQGTYKPTTTTGPASLTISFAMKNGVTIVGGFPATGTPTLSQRNPTSFTTTLSGDIGTEGTKFDNSYHVLNNPAGLTSSAVLDGFLITGGNANGNQSSGRNRDGGGMLNNGGGAGNACSPLLRNCIFQNNAAVNSGGALYNDGYSGGTSSPSLINCLFLSNSVANRGGALYNDGGFGGTSSPVLTNCSFLGNSAPSSGGAISSGGALYNDGNSRPVLTNCVVSGNGGASTFTNVSGAFITTRYSLLEASVTSYNAGTGNLTTTVSPFVSRTDARLNVCSPAINAGDNAAYTSANGPTTDLAGNARIFPSGGVIDMGAYEFQAATGIITPGVSTATVGVSFSQSFTAAGGSGSFSYSLVSGSLPPGLSLATTGLLSGTPTQVGSFTLTLKATDATGCSVVSLPYVLTVLEPAPDLTPLLYARPALLYGSAPLTVVVDVVEINGVGTTGLITLRITKDARMSLILDNSQTRVGERSVDNSSWSLTTDANYYILTSSAPLMGGGQRSVGLSGQFASGSTTGVLTCSATVVYGSERTVGNNTDADKIEYFQQ